MSNEINVGAISEALNNKVDLNQLNTNEQGLEYVSGLSMPSNRYIDLTLGASGTQYTAPANGFYYLSLTRNGTNGRIYIETSYYGVKSVPENGGAIAVALLPVLKNSIVSVGYDAYNSYKFRFIYAEGVE